MSYSGCIPMTWQENHCFMYAGSDSRTTIKKIVSYSREPVQNLPHGANSYSVKNVAEIGKQEEVFTNYAPGIMKNHPVVSFQLSVGKRWSRHILRESFGLLLHFRKLIKNKYTAR